MKVLLALVLALLAGPAVAQHHGHGGHGHGQPQQGQGQQGHGQHGQGQASPYSGLQQRSIKALSETQLADLKAGRGMGLALAAELNGYPGPLHVLELGKKLNLTPEQTRRFQALFDSMKQEAIAAGEELIAREQALDEAFAKGHLTADALAEHTRQIGIAQGTLRTVHLKYHLTSAELLSHDQKRQYAELRGYR